MQCPRCATELLPHSLMCAHCGTPLTVPQAVATMRQDLHQAQQESARLVTQLDHMQERFDAFTALIRENLTVSVSEPVTPVALKPPPLPTPPVAQEPPPERRRGTEVQVGQQWLLIAGIAITVLGIGFFLKYAFDHNWVGPTGQIALAYLAAVVFLGVGDVFRRRQAMTFGLYLIGGGIATLYLTTFAALQLYHLIGQTVAFSAMVLVTVLAGCLALVYDAKWLAVIGLIGGFFTPVILGTGQEQQIVLMSYMALVNGGILALAVARRWQILNALGFILTWLLFAAWFARHYTAAQFWPTLFFLHLFFLIYVLVSFLYYFIRQHQERVTGLVIALLNTGITCAFAFGMIRGHTSLAAVSIATLSYAALFLGLAGLLQRRHPERLDVFVFLLGQGLTFLILTVPMLFSDQWITTFWAIQAGVFLWVGMRLQNRWLRDGAVVLLALSIGKWLLYDYELVFHLRWLKLTYARDFAWLLLERWSTIVMVLGSTLWSAYRWRAMDTASAPGAGMTGVLYGAFAVLLFATLTIEVSAGMHVWAPQARFAAISVLWALFSIVLMLVGFLRDHTVLRVSALGLFAVTIVKVLLADMAQASTPFRIVSFVALGLLLIGASYLYYRYKEHLLPNATKSVH